MKTATAHKIDLIRKTVRAKKVAHIRIAGLPEEFTVKDLRNHNHSVDLLLDRNNGYLVVDPDDIVAVRLHEMPARADAEAI